jgi:hypothetical protein
VWRLYYSTKIFVQKYMWFPKSFIYTANVIFNSYTIDTLAQTYLLSLIAEEREEEAARQTVVLAKYAGPVRIVKKP